MVNTGALFTENFYKKYINPIADDKRMLRIGRYSGLILSLSGVVFALTIKNVLHAFLFTETIAAFMGIIVLGGMIWKRANRFGAMAAVVLSFSVYYVINFIQTGSLMLVYKWHPAPFGWAMLAGFAAFILISLITKPENQSRMDLFFNKLRMSSDPEDQLADGTKKTARETGKDMLILDMPGWSKRDRWKDFFSRYREDIGGFILSWAFVGLLIVLAWAIMQIN